MERAWTAVQASSVPAGPSASTPAAVRAASMQATTLLACAELVAPGAQSRATCPTASAVQQRAAPA
eukprot:10357302-Alexandrium_andersonii.AAC.1